MDKIIENKINELTKYAFESYSKIDFVDVYTKSPSVSKYTRYRGLSPLTR